MINSHTYLYCIFGRPVKHSKSPLIHNAWFEQYKINAAYLAFEINNISDAVAAIKTFNIKGASVTIPFKESVLNFLDHIDQNALKIGAVNTIVNSKNKLKGFNTDSAAAIAPLKNSGIEDKKICIIGAGGAARAVAHGVNKKRGHLTIINRSIEKGRKLALKYHAAFISMDEINKTSDLEADIIINTTPIGMHPETEASPFPSHLLKQGMTVMDIIYNPLRTKLLTQAQKKGCKTVDGLSMFMHQGAEQFALWTGIKPEIKIVQDQIVNSTVKP